MQNRHQTKYFDRVLGHLCFRRSINGQLVPQYGIYLNTAQNVSNVCKRPEGNVGHLKSAFVVDVIVTVNLIDFVVHEGLGDQAVHPGHVCRREFMRIELPRAAEQHHLPIISLQQWDQIPGVDYLRQIWVVAIQISKPIRVELSDYEVPFQHLTCLGYTEFFCTQKA